MLSASFDADGNCPDADSTQYLSGLTPSDTCILIILEDGGPNDYDLRSNGVIKDPGVLTLRNPNSSSLIQVAQNTMVIEGDSVNIDASLTTDAENDTLIYTWQQTGGLAIGIDENSSPLLSFASPLVSKNETLLFRLSVFDGIDTSSTNLSVTIKNQNHAPQATIESHDPSLNEVAQMIVEEVPWALSVF